MHPTVILFAVMLPLGLALAALVLDMVSEL